MTTFSLTAWARAYHRHAEGFMPDARRVHKRRARSWDFLGKDTLLPIDLNLLISFRLRGVDLVWRRDAGRRYHPRPWPRRVQLRRMPSDWATRWADVLHRVREQDVDIPWRHAFGREEALEFLSVARSLHRSVGRMVERRDRRDWSSVDHDVRRLTELLGARPLRNEKEARRIL